MSVVGAATGAAGICGIYSSGLGLASFVGGQKEARARQIFGGGKKKDFEDWGPGSQKDGRGRKVNLNKNPAISIVLVFFSGADLKLIIPFDQNCSPTVEGTRQPNGDATSQSNGREGHLSTTTTM